MYDENSNVVLYGTNPISTKPEDLQIEQELLKVFEDIAEKHHEDVSSPGQMALS